MVGFDIIDMILSYIWERKHGMLNDKTILDVNLFVKCVCFVRVKSAIPLP